MEKFWSNAVLDFFVAALTWGLIRWHTHDANLAYTAGVLAVFLRPPMGSK